MDATLVTAHSGFRAVRVYLPPVEDMISVWAALITRDVVAWQITDGGSRPIPVGRLHSGWEADCECLDGVATYDGRVMCTGQPDFKTITDFLQHAIAEAQAYRAGKRRSQDGTDGYLATP